MSGNSSFGQILRSSSIIGGATAINVLIGLFRTKIAALLLGPSGVGVIGLLQNLVSTVAMMGSMGLGNVGARQIAEAAAHEESNRVAVTRHALFWATAILAVVSGALLWSLRALVARRVLGDGTMASSVGWLGLAVSVSIVGASQAAFLTGFRRIGDLARVSVISSILSCLAGVASLYLFGAQGIFFFILSAPLSSFFVGWFYCLKLARSGRISTPLRNLVPEWRAMAALGGAVMIGGLAAQAGQLLVRAMVQRQLGLVELGHFHAAWIISMTYIGFILQAMGTDYYPRLTATIGDADVTNRLVNEQTEVALLLAAPLLLGLLGAAPWILQLLYSGEFRSAADILRWQVLGDLFKIASWPMGFLLLAGGNGRVFIATESSAITVFVLLVWIGLPVLGIEATGVAFLGMYLFYLPLVYLIAWRKTRFRWSRPVLKLFVLLAGLCVTVVGLSLFNDLVGLAFAWAGAALMAAFSARRFRDHFRRHAAIS